MLLSSAYIHLECKEFIKYTAEIASASQRILLSGPIGKTVYAFFVYGWISRMQSLPSVTLTLSLLRITGSEIYQETLAKALAKHFGARLLIIDSLVLPGVSFLQFQC